MFGNPYYTDVVRAQAILNNFESDKLYTKKEYQAIAANIDCLPKEWHLDKNKFMKDWNYNRPSDIWYQADFILEKIEEFEIKKPILYIMPNAKALKSFQKAMLRDPYYTYCITYYYDGYEFRVKNGNLSFAIIRDEERFKNVKNSYKTFENTETIKAKRYYAKINANYLQKIIAHVSQEDLEKAKQITTLKEQLKKIKAEIRALRESAKTIEI